MSALGPYPVENPTSQLSWLPPAADILFVAGRHGPIDCGRTGEVLGVIEDGVEGALLQSNRLISASACSCDGRACAGLERAADPLNRAGVYAEPLGDLAHTRPPWVAQSRADDCFHLGHAPVACRERYYSLSASETRGSVELPRPISEGFYSYSRAAHTTPWQWAAGSPLGHQRRARALSLKGHGGRDCKGVFEAASQWHIASFAAWTLPRGARLRPAGFRLSAGTRGGRNTGG